MSVIKEIKTAVSEYFKAISFKKPKIDITKEYENATFSKREAFKKKLRAHGFNPNEVLKRKVK